MTSLTWYEHIAYIVPVKFSIMESCRAMCYSANSSHFANAKDEQYRLYLALLAYSNIILMADECGDTIIMYKPGNGIGRRIASGEKHA